VNFTSLHFTSLYSLASFVIGSCITPGIENQVIFMKQHQRKLSQKNFFTTQKFVGCARYCIRSLLIRAVFLLKFGMVDHPNIMEREIVLHPLFRKLISIRRGKILLLRYEIY